MKPKPKAEDLRKFYYYNRDDDHRITSTFCFVADPGGNTWAVGRAYRAADDNPCKKTGRRLATSRALAAFYAGRGEVRTRPDKKNMVASWFMPPPTELEKKFLRSVASPTKDAE